MTVERSRALAELLLGSHRPLPAARFYVFGATGDLVSKRAVRDAMVFLAERGLVDGNHNRFVLLAQKSISGSAYLEAFERGDAESNPVSRAGMQAFARLAHLETPNARLLAVGVDQPGDYETLARDLGQENAVFYAALPPRLYPTLLRHLKDSGLAHRPLGGFRRVLLEKPFGTNSNEAEQLRQQIEQHFEPQQVLLVDHFLAYPGTTNMLSFRAHPEVDEALCGDFVERFEVKILESIQSNDRPYFRDTGLLKDMVQNHAMQVFATMAMDLPEEINGPALRAQAERAMSAVVVDDDSCHYAQFEGFNDPARGAPTGAPDSAVETYVAFDFRVDLPRWKSVTFHLVAAKGVDHKRSGIDVHFHHLPPRLAARWGVETDQPAVLHATMNPQARLSVEFPELGTTLDLPRENGVPDRPPYVQVFLQAIRGESALFATPGESLAGWRLVEHLAGVMKRCPMGSYAIGTPVEQIQSP